MQSYSKNELQHDYLKSHGCDSACPRCNKWESEGNVIYTEPYKPHDLSDKRTCTNCDHTWRAIFTPAGFVQVKD